MLLSKLTCISKMMIGITDHVVVQACWNQRCQDVSLFGVDECQSKCNGHGVSKPAACLPFIGVILYSLQWTGPYCC